MVARTAASGIATGVILAIARIAGETAPLLFTAFGNRFWSTSLHEPHRLAHGAGLHLRDFAVSRLAAPGVGRSAGAHGHRAGAGVGRKMGDARERASRALDAMADKLVVTSSERLFRADPRRPRHQPGLPGQRADGDHRTFGMRQVDPGAMPQPDA